MKHLTPILLVFLSCCLCPPAVAGGDDVIRVSGTGTVSSKPDRATIFMRVSDVDKSIVSAKKAVDEKVGRIQKMLLDSGVRPDSINTSGLGVHEERDGSGNMAGQRGYRVSRDIVAQIEDLSALDAMLDNALNLGANSIQNIQFQASAIDGLRLAALEKASDDARRKAEFLARKFGCRLGPAVEIEYDYKGQVQPYYGLAAGSMRGGEPFLQGTIEISATVNAVYRIR